MAYIPSHRVWEDARPRPRQFDDFDQLVLPVIPARDH